MDDTSVIRLSEQMAVMSSQLDGMAGQLGEIKTDLKDLSAAAPIHRITALEQWRDESKTSVADIPELVRWKTNVNRWLAALLLGVLLAAAGALFAVITSR